MEAGTDTTKAIHSFDFQDGTSLDASQFFDLFYEKLCHWALKVTSDRELARDLVSDSILKLLKSQIAFDSFSHLKNNLYTTTRNSYIDYLRHSNIVNQHRRHLALESEDHIDLREIVEVKFELAYAEELLNDAIKTLPTKSRKMIEYRLKGLSNAEIAEELNVPLHVVKNTISRAIRVLRPQIPDFGVALLLVFLSIDLAI
jgi:RNA polymerase sigma factor (sigma-70 family)